MVHVFYAFLVHFRFVGNFFVERTNNFRFELDPSLQLSEIVQKLPYNLTGADLYALCSDAMLSALKRKIHSLDQGEQFSSRK